MVAALTGSGVAATEAKPYRRAHGDGDLARWGLVERLEHPVTGERPYLAMPVQIDGRPWRSSRPAACFAQHTDEVLTDWVGTSAAERARLRAAQVIGTTPPTRRR